MIYTKIKQFWMLPLSVLGLLGLTQCEKSPSNTQNELITRISVQLIGSGFATFNQTFEAVDADGDGVFDSIDTISIPNSPLLCQLGVYDDSKNPVDTITLEIQAENEAHLFVFDSNVPGFSVDNRNTDDAGNPFGLMSVWNPTLTGSGNVRIRLIHEPSDKNASDPGGETDFDVTFPLKIQ